MVNAVFYVGAAICTTPSRIVFLNGYEQRNQQ